MYVKLNVVVYIILLNQVVQAALMLLILGGDETHARSNNTKWYNISILIFNTYMPSQFWIYDPSTRVQVHY